MTNLFFHFYQFIQKRRKAFIGVIGLLVLFLGYLAAQIKLEENILNLIPQDKEIRYINKVLQSFKLNEQMVMHVYQAEEGESANADQLIDFAHEFVDTLQVLSGQHIDSIRIEFSDSNIETLYDYYLNNIPFYLDDEDYKELEEKISKDGIRKTLDKSLKALMSPMSMVTKKMTIKDPFGLVNKPLQRARELQQDDKIGLYQNHLVSKDSKHLIFFIDLTNPPNETKNNGKLIADFDQLIQHYSTSNYRIEYFGQAAVAVGNAQRIKGDIMLTVSLAIMTLFIFISLFYKKVYTFVLVLLPGVFGGLLGVAVLTLFRPSISAISLGVGSILLGVTIDFALHFVTHYTQQKDIRKLFSDISLPILISAITTSCAFLSLLLIRSNALKDLGLFAGVSVISAALFTLIVLPHLVIGKSEIKDVKLNFIQKIISSLAKFPFHKSKWALSVFAIITVVSLFTWKNFAFETDMLKLNYLTPELEGYEKNLNQVSNFSVNNVYLVTSGGNIWEALRNNKPLNSRLNKALKDSLILDHLTVNDIIPDKTIQENRLKEWHLFWNKNNKSSVVQSLNIEAESVGFNRNTFNHVNTVLYKNYNSISEEDVNNLLSVFGEDLIIENDEGTSVVSSVKLLAKNKASFIELVKGMPNVTIIDKGYFTSRLVSLLKEDFSRLVNASLIIVFLIILLSYGRIELSLIAFIPILLSWLWTLGVMGLLDLKFNIVNIIICTFIFGLGIDYSIFVVRGLTQKYKYNQDDLFSFKKSILLSAITTLVGIGVLVFAQHPALKSIALLAIIGIVSVIFITFTIPPILYNFLIQNRKNKGEVAYSGISFLFSVWAFFQFVIGCFVLIPFHILLRLPIGNIKTRKLLFHYLISFFSRTLLFFMGNVKKSLIDKHNIDFSKPSVIIANHHSFVDILLLLGLHPKIVMVTNEWVYNSPFFGKIVQFADFILSSEGVETQTKKINNLIEDGYSIIVYPEGTRSPSFKLGRFKKGAFFLAEQFNLDIQPVVLHGTSYVMPKLDGFAMKMGGDMVLKFLPRISNNDTSFGTGYSKRTKKISNYFKAEYQKYRDRAEYPSYFKHVLIGNYLYKGPILEWYLRIKYKLENEYRLFHDLIPKKGKIVDVGCGYGLMSFALAFSGEDREVLAIDYDEDKIDVAKNCPSIPEKLKFEVGDIVKYSYHITDAFVVSDVLHYLTTEAQQQLLQNLLNNLSKNGMMIIRDGDSEKTKRHKGTKLTEIISTRIGFNKTQNELNYISGELIRSFAMENNLNLEIIDKSKLTSNVLFVLRRSNS
ncbi:MAG: MMPL family transporter [Cyclobacteriaceae bacterium]|nr:MMPL family transporter [Cyclobacteriaceae bacterium]